jgi:hypothetical protein
LILDIEEANGSLIAIGGKGVPNLSLLIHMPRGKCIFGDLENMMA